MKTSKKFRNHVRVILEQMPGFGDTAACREFVKSKNGGLMKHYKDQIIDAALDSAICYIQRNSRLPENRHVPAFPSIEVPTGEFDEETGEPLTERRYASMKQMLLAQDWVSVDKVVDQQVKRARSAMSIANATVMAARLRGYQRDLPFPEMEDEESVAG